MRAWMFSAASPSPLQRPCERLVVGASRGVDRQLDQLRAQVRGDRAGVGLRPLARVSGGHHHAGEPFGAERIGRDERHQRRVDAARQAHDGALEAVLAGVVAHAEHERLIDLVQVVERLLQPSRRPAELPQQQVGGELPGPGHGLARGVDDEAVAVEDELVLAADEVAEGDRHAVGAGPLREHLLALDALAAQVGRARRVQEELRPGLRLQRAGRPRLPEVLADREPEARSAELDQLRLATGLEVADLVEDAVVGEPVLAVDGLDLAVPQGRERVVDRAPRGAVRQPVGALTGGGLGESDQRRDPPRLAREPLERGDVRLGEVVLEIEVLSRVTRE